MKTVAVLALLTLLLLPGVAMASSATDAALGLGAFAVFNQIIAGTGLFGGRPVVVAPPPVVVAPAAPVYVAPPPPVYYAPRPVVVAPPPVIVRPAPAYVHPAPPRYQRVYGRPWHDGRAPHGHHAR